MRLFAIVLLLGLAACVPEADDALKLHDIALFSNASDLNVLHGYLYGAPRTLLVGSQEVALTEGSASDPFAVSSALLVDGQPYLRQNLETLSPPPSRVQRIPLTTEVQVEIGERVDELVYFDGTNWFTLLDSSLPGFRATIVPKQRIGGMRGLGQLTREEAEMLMRVLEPRHPVAVTVIPSPSLPARRVDGLAEYARTALYIQQTVPTDEEAYRPPARNLIWEVTAQGNNAVGVESAAYLLITNEEHLLSAWNRAYGAQLSVPALPNINFERETMLAIFLGTKPTGGYGLEVQDMSLEQRDVYVDISLTEPAAGAITTQALTSPWLMLRVLRSGVDAAWFRDARSGELIGVARRTE